MAATTWRDNLRNARSVWVENRNGSMASRDVYAQGRNLVSPTKNSKGADVYHLMREIKRGDAVLHLQKDGNNRIFSGVSLVRRGYKEVSNKTPYYIVDLSNFISLDFSFSEFLHRYEHEIRKEMDNDRPQYYPFRRRKNHITLADPYITSATSRLLQLFLNATEGDGTSVVDDVQKIQDNNSLDQTTKQRLIDARLGQGRFRRQLEEIWGNKCAVLGCETRELLRASHVQAWSESSSKEQTDKNNGLLLSAHLDALFDKGLISFSDGGEMIVSPSVSTGDRQILTLGDRLNKKPWPLLIKYLKSHRKKHDDKLNPIPF